MVHDVITPKKTNINDLLELLSEEELEPDSCKNRICNAPEKDRESQCSIFPDRKPAVRVPFRLMRQFTPLGQYQETIRTKSHILKLLTQDNK